MDLLDLKMDELGIPKSSQIKPHLRDGISYYEARYELMLLKINYLDQWFLGFRPPDPFDEVDWGSFSRTRQELELLANLNWEKLRVLNLGFDLIHDAAIQLDREFPFSSPRELFVAILKGQIRHEISPLLKDGILEGATLSQLSWIGKHQSALFRGRFDGEPEEKEFLDSCLTQGWNGFWYYGIWRDRFKSTLREDWNKYLKAHKELVAFSKTGKGSVQWTKGRLATSSRKMLQPSFFGVIEYPSPLYRS
jgi:hypothetical protein